MRTCMAWVLVAASAALGAVGGRAARAGEAAVRAEGTYMVVDMGGGRQAPAWPVGYLSEVPAGGWSGEFKTTKLVLRRIPAGRFRMGSPGGELGRVRWGEERREVEVAEPYYLGVFELTQAQWAAAMGGNPSDYRGDERPVECVSYAMIRGSGAGTNLPPAAVGADGFLAVLRAKTGLRFDLPTEVQWEYACRAGTETALNTGANLTDKAACPYMARAGRFEHNRGDGRGGYGEHTAVGCYQPNAWGLYDMHGNVVEWCLDNGDHGDDQRIVRGGGAYSEAWQCRSAVSFHARIDEATFTLGFRVCCNPHAAEGGAAVPAPASPDRREAAPATPVRPQPPAELAPMAAAVEAARRAKTADSFGKMEAEWRALPDGPKRSLQECVLRASCAMLLSKGNTKAVAARKAYVDTQDLLDAVTEPCPACRGRGHSQENCRECAGSGRCPFCRGSGHTSGLNGRQGSCPKCNSSGRCPACSGGTREAKCRSCGGSGRTISEAKCRQVVDENLDRALRICRGEE